MIPLFGRGTLLLLSIFSVLSGAFVEAQQKDSAPCQNQVEQPLAHADETLLAGWPEQKLLARLKQLLADAHLEASCVENGKSFDFSPLSVFVLVPDKSQLDQPLKDKGGWLASLQLQLQGVSGGLDLGEGAPAIEAQRLAIPLASTANLESIYSNRGGEILARDKVSYSVLDFVFIPRIERVASGASLEDSENESARYRVFPVSIVPSRVLNEVVRLDPGTEFETELILRSWKDELERAGLRLIEILQDNELVYFKDNYLETKDYSFQEVRAFDLVLVRQLQPLILLSEMAAEGEFSFWQVFDRFWEEYAQKADLVKKRDEVERPGG